MRAQKHNPATGSAGCTESEEIEDRLPCGWRLYKSDLIGCIGATQQQRLAAANEWSHRVLPDANTCFNRLPTSIEQASYHPEPLNSSS